MNPPPLAGIRVLDLSRLLPGPYCTSLLADLGAEVIKVEMPGSGDTARLFPKDMGGDSSFQVVNRNKKSVALNYRDERGLQVLLRLATKADVLVEGFRAGAPLRWGLGYEAIRQANPSVVYCSLSGYGQDGPYAQRAGHDLNYQALGGLLSLNGATGGPPLPTGVQIADLGGGMLAAIAILGALFARQQTGQGAYLDVSMLDAVVSWLAPVAGALYLHTGQNPSRGATPLTGSLPSYNVYVAADGKYLALSALEPHFWTAFCQALGREDFATRQFDAGLIPELAALFAQRTRAEWLALLSPADACLEPVNDVDQALRDPQVRARGLVVEVESPAGSEPASGPPWRFGSPFQSVERGADVPAPKLGQDTYELLRQAGFHDTEIRELAEVKIVRLGSG
jgi:crotonobetainyl-CoA:carnitine CoA-transferase CaiB-like acyl-CoA transferase